MGEERGLTFTGERFVPTLAGQIKYEHLHRYALAMDIAAGKVVLDIASGEGYGAALLARVAAAVVGVDLSPESVEHARRSYYYENLEFLVGACDAVPLADASVDVVTSFETIEHHDKHEEMLAEFKRVLRPGGVAVISSPNRLTYSDEPHYVNPFHVKELYYDEFRELLGRHFKHVRIYGQRLATASFVYQLQNTHARQLQSYAGNVEHVAPRLCSLPAPIYFVAVCSDKPLDKRARLNSLYVDGDDDLMRQAEDERKELFRQTQEQLAQLELAWQLEQLLETERARAAAAEERAAQAEEAAAQVPRQAEELTAVKTHLKTAEELLATREAEARRQAEELAAVKTHLKTAEELLAGQAVELAGVRAELDAYAAQMSRQATETALLHDRLAAGARLLGNFEAQAAARATQLAAHETRRAELQAELTATHTQLASARAHLHHLDDTLAEVRARLLHKQMLLDWMAYSRSWQLTTPLRRLSLAGHSLRQRLPDKGREVFRGYIDAPCEGDSAAGYLEVGGWAYSVVAPIRRVEAFLDHMPLGTVRYGYARPDVTANFAEQLPPDCGYADRLPLDELFSGPRTLMIRVTDERGNYRDYTRTIMVEAGRGAPALDMPPPEFAAAPPVPVETPTLVKVPVEDDLATTKQLLSARAVTDLEYFLFSDATIELPQFDEPELSIILVLYNRAELTLQCLNSIRQSSTGSYELVIVDNASSDQTRVLLRRVKGARIIENETNLHYLRACNQAARAACGPYLLLLNNDTQLPPDSIPAALATLRSAPDIGAVGGKIILPDGTLQEAGSIIWRDGSCLGYGRGAAPDAPEYMFRRDVDYCSAAFLLTRRELFLADDGFDEAYAPAYYEETDYCVRLWKQGLRVVYDPNVIIHHYEFASSGSTQSAIALQAQHQQIFRRKHRDWLATRPAHTPDAVLKARMRLSRTSRRILFLDDRTPHITLGSGFPRSNRIVTELTRMGHFVTFYPCNFPQEEWASVYQDIPREVEVMVDYGAARLAEFLAARADYYDLIFVSRPHNMDTLKAALAHDAHLGRGAQIIYDAEAIFALRASEQARLAGRPFTPEQERRLVAEELSLAEGCHRVVAVSERESSEFSRCGFKHVHTLGHAVHVSPTPRGFAERRDILFVGAIHALDSPNGDSVVWFSEEIFPLIRRALGEDVQFLIAGPICPELKHRLGDSAAQLLGRMDDLTELYNRARLFVAPTRFSAGIPLKVHEAAAHGLPVVTTPLIGKQLEWTDGGELLIAGDAHEFATACVRLYRDQTLWQRLRARALARVAQDCSPAAFAERLRAIITPTDN